MRSTSPDDTFDSPSSSDDGDGPSAKLATKGATKRKSKASATGGGAAATHGATGVEGKKGRTSSASKADDGASRKSSSEPKVCRHPLRTGCRRGCPSRLATQTSTS